MKDWVNISQRLIMLGQLGLSLVMPVLILTSRVGLGLWIYFPGLIFGLGASFMTAYKLWIKVIERERKKGEEEPPAFNSHN